MSIRDEDLYKVKLRLLEVKRIPRKLGREQSGVSARPVFALDIPSLEYGVELSQHSLTICMHMLPIFPLFASSSDKTFPVAHKEQQIGLSARRTDHPTATMCS